MRDIHFHAQLTQTSLLTKHRPRINRTPVSPSICYPHPLARRLAAYDRERCASKTKDVRSAIEGISSLLSTAFPLQILGSRSFTHSLFTRNPHQSLLRGVFQERLPTLRNLRLHLKIESPVLCINRKRGVTLATSYFRTTYRRTIIGAAAFNFRVRNGYGWCRCAEITRNLI